MELTIPNIATYRAEMSKSMVDKLFFLDHVEVNTLVDFGCADGTLLSFLSDMRPKMNLVGYDNSQEMIQLALGNEAWSHKSFESGLMPWFVSDWNYIQGLFKYKKKDHTIALNLSSVIHEVYSYGDENSVNEFWDRVFNAGFDYIIIRDMLVSKSADKESKAKDVEKIYNSHNENLTEFESVWGPISNQRNLLHYLLKYRYNKNWFRELRENYLPITLEDMLSRIPTDKYSYELYEHYTLPFVKSSVKKEFNITLTENTHIKMILKLK